MDTPMHRLSAEKILAVWEAGRRQHSLDRALTLLAAVSPETTRDALAELSIAERDARLLELRGNIFGSRVAAKADCPACSQSIEMNFAVSKVRTVPVSELPETCAAKFGKYEIRFRLPNSNDLAVLVRDEDIATQKRRLVQKCVLDAKCSSQPVAADQLPDDTVTALSERMSELDPQDDVQVALTCPQCSHRWDAPFDIASFVWSEIHAWAMRLLRDVHVLASVYGWREKDILAMSPWRRQAYLELIER
jgi:T4 bacteriophage base plate protein